MSFLSILGTIGHVVKVGVADVMPLEPAIAAIPVAGAPIAVALSAITAVEAIVSKAGSGTAKKAAATAVVNAAVPGIDPAALSTSIDQIVAALNALTKAEQALKPATP